MFRIVHLKIFKTILKVVYYFTAIFQKQRNSKWRGLYSFCEKKCYCGVNSKIWIRRYSLFWRKGQTQATAYLWWWGIVFLMFLFLFSFGVCRGEAVGTLFFDRLQMVPIKGKIVFCTLQNLCQTIILSFSAYCPAYNIGHGFFYTM